MQCYKHLLLKPISIYGSELYAHVSYCNIGIIQRAQPEILGTITEAQNIASSPRILTT